MPRPLPQDILLADSVGLSDAILRTLADAETHVFAEIMQFVTPRLPEGDPLHEILRIFAYGTCDE